MVKMVATERIIVIFIMLILPKWNNLIFFSDLFYLLYIIIVFDSKVVDIIFIFIGNLLYCFMCFLVPHSSPVVPHSSPVVPLEVFFTCCHPISQSMACVR